MYMYIRTYKTRENESIQFNSTALYSSDAFFHKSTRIGMCSDHVANGDVSKVAQVFLIELLRKMNVNRRKQTK